MLGLSIFGARCIIEAYATLLYADISSICFQGTNIFATLSWIVAFAASMIWLFKSLRSKVEKAIPVLAFVISCSAALVVNNVFHSTTWPNIDQDILVSYAFIQLLYSVFMTGKLTFESCSCARVNNDVWLFSVTWSRGSPGSGVKDGESDPKGLLCEIYFTRNSV